MNYEFKNKLKARLYEQLINEQIAKPIKNILVDPSLWIPWIKGIFRTDIERFGVRLFSNKETIQQFLGRTLTAEEGAAMRAAGTWERYVNTRRDAEEFWNIIENWGGVGKFGLNNFDNFHLTEEGRYFVQNIETGEWYGVGVRGIPNPSPPPSTLVRLYPEFLMPEGWKPGMDYPHDVGGGQGVGTMRNPNNSHGIGVGVGVGVGGGIIHNGSGPGSGTIESGQRPTERPGMNPYNQEYDTPYYQA